MLNTSYPNFDEFYQLSVSTTGTLLQFPTGSAVMYRVKALASNSGQVFLTNKDSQEGLPLGASEDTGWNPATSQMQSMWYYGTIANDVISVWLKK